MTVLVQPRNEEQLKRICQMLAAEAIRAKDVGTAAKVGEILSYIHDPIAVPYLVEVLQEVGRRGI